MNDIKLMNSLGLSDAKKHLDNLDEFYKNYIILLDKKDISDFEETNKNFIEMLARRSDNNRMYAYSYANFERPTLHNTILNKINSVGKEFKDSISEFKRKSKNYNMDQIEITNMIIPILYYCEINSSNLIEKYKYSIENGGDLFNELSNVMTMEIHRGRRNGLIEILEDLKLFFSKNNNQYINLIINMFEQKINE